MYELEGKLIKSVGRTCLDQPIEKFLALIISNCVKPLIRISMMCEVYLDGYLDLTRRELLSTLG